MASISLSMGTRQKFQVSMTPAKTLAQALAEYCSKFDLDASEHTLVHNKKVLDLSLSWRLSGISANANLEVKKAASSSKAGDEATVATIQVAVTLESGRHIMSFPSSTSIWNILKSVETDKKIELLTTTTVKKGKDGHKHNFYNQPIVNFMSTDLSTNTDLRKTTLAGLGVKSGSAVLRVRFKVTDIESSEFFTLDAALAQEEAEHAKITDQRVQDAKVAAQVRQQEEAERRIVEEAERRAAEDRLEAERRAQILAREKSETEKLEAERLKREENEAHQFERDLASATQASLTSSSSSSAPAPSSSHSPSANAMDIDTPPAAAPQARKKFEVVVEPPGPPLDPHIAKVLMEGGMLEKDHSKLHDLLRKQPDFMEKANQIPSEPCARDIKVFAPSTKPFDPSSIVIPADFFEVQPEDVAKPKSTNARASEEQMKTQAMRDKERLQKLSRFKKCIIRFRFPDRIELQGNFYPQESLVHLEAFVREHLADPTLRFYLFTTPPTTNVHETKNLRDQNFLPAALVHVALHPNVTATSPFLKPEVLTLIQEKNFQPVVIEYKHASNMTFVGESSSSTKPISAATSSMDVDKQENSKDKKSDKKKVPKWFSAGMKKK